MKDDSAFPHQLGRDNKPGMTLRDYFAAKALQAFVSRKDIDGLGKEKLATSDYSLADAMIAAREV